MLEICKLNPGEAFSTIKLVKTLALYYQEYAILINTIWFAHLERSVREKYFEKFKKKIELIVEKQQDFRAYAEQIDLTLAFLSTQKPAEQFVGFSFASLCLFHRFVNQEQEPSSFGFQGAPIVRVLFNFVPDEATTLKLNAKKSLDFFFLYSASVFGYDKVIDLIVRKELFLEALDKFENIEKDKVELLFSNAGLKYLVEVIKPKDLPFVLV